MSVRILVLFAHPALEKSRVNRELVRSIRDLDGVTVRDLYELYPDFHIDVAQEKSLCEAHDLLVLQHPFYWYSVPAIIKEWFDLVLEHGWAYGGTGNALVGKGTLSAVTTGGKAEAYCAEGANRYTVRQLLAPVERTAVLCGMTYLPPFVVHGTHAMAAEQIREAAVSYRHVIEALRDETLDLDRAPAHRLNADLGAIGLD